MRPSIKDVAKRSGTSISTVSNVLNKRRKVSDELARRVIRAVEELGYVVNPVASSLKSHKTGVIGVIITDINCIFFPPMLKGICNMLSAAGYTVSLYDTRQSPEREIKYIELLSNMMAEGVILDSVAAASQKAYFETLGHKSGGMPIVCVENDMRPFGFDSVMIDNRAGAYTAVKHLIEMGCRRIVHISNSNASMIAKNRQDGYWDALKDAGISRDPALICEGDFSPQSGYRGMSKVIRSGVSFDGVFAANDQMAIGALRALDAAGMKVPDDVKIVGYDNTFVSSMVNPSLTTISVPGYEMGTVAAQLLLDRMARPELPVHRVLLEYELLIRRSTVASAKTSWDMTYW